MLLIAASLFLTNPLPLELPRASAYLVREKGIRRLEDRYDRLDLWVSQSVDGRWLDEEGRVFMLSHLDRLPPIAEGMVTRTAAEQDRIAIDKRDLKALRQAIDPLSPIEIAAEPKAIRRLPRGYRDVDYWQGTNRSAIVCAYLPEKAKVWRLAAWELVEGDDFDDALEVFEEEFIRKEGVSKPRTAVRLARGASEPRTAVRLARGASEPSERELLRRDAHHSISAYDNWHFTSSDDFVVLDDLPTDSFAALVTNDLTRMRRLYAETLPTPIDGANVLAVARIYANRDEYLDALEAVGLTNMTWSAAYWSPQRRELVAHASSTSDHKLLLSTLRHEAFHQYLSYATSFLPTSPWLNEGYAQYFETFPADKPDISPEDIERYSFLLPSLFLMDYAEFYSGTDEERALKYALAKSIVIFLERGADKVRFKPFKNFKADYLEALFETHDPVKATSAAFQHKRELMEKFVGEWIVYWKSHL